jgi:hypothetical protein
VSCAVEALRIFGHCHFRVLQYAATMANRPLVLAKPPRHAGEVSWCKRTAPIPAKIRGRELFSQDARIPKPPEGVLITGTAGAVRRSRGLFCWSRCISGPARASVFTDAGRRLP